MAAQYPLAFARAPVPIKHAIEQDSITPFPKPSTVDLSIDAAGDDDLISSLEVKTYGKRRFLKYQATWWPEVLLPGVLAVQRRFQAWPSDVILASYPKSGTTWVKALAFVTMSRKNYSSPADHPLRKLNPHDCVVHLPGAYAAGKESVVEALPSPRIMALHMPYSTLPDSIVNSSSKIIYVWRDPKDVLVSLWHYYLKVHPDEAHLTPFTELYESFCQGETVFGPWWNNVLGYWRASKDVPARVLFLRYEDMLEDTASSVKTIAQFVGFPFSGEEEGQQEEGLTVEEIVQLCSFDELKNLEVNKSGKQGLLRKHSSSSYFRKGVAGDWRDNMTQEMADRIDTIAREKLQGSGLLI